MQNSCKTIIENIEKVDRYDGMKSWKFGDIFTFDIESKKLKFWPLIIKNNFEARMNNWLYYYIQHTLDIGEPFYKYHGYGVLNPLCVHHVRSINDFLLSNSRS